MKKVFISQPMGGYSEAQILYERERTMKMAEKILHENLMLIDTYFPDECKKGINVQGKIIRAILDADVVVFVRQGAFTSGCKFEYSVAERLEKPIIEIVNGVAILTNVYKEEE